LNTFLRRTSVTALLEVMTLSLVSAPSRTSSFERLDKYAGEPARDRSLGSDAVREVTWSGRSINDTQPLDGLVHKLA
jgi:hypothetical protein